METDYKWYCRHCGKATPFTEDEFFEINAKAHLQGSIASLHEKVDILVANKTPMQHRVAALEKNSKALEIVKEIIEVETSPGSTSIVWLVNKLKETRNALKGR